MDSKENQIFNDKMQQLTAFKTWGYSYWEESKQLKWGSTGEKCEIRNSYVISSNISSKIIRHIYQRILHLNKQIRYTKDEVSSEKLQWKYTGKWHRKSMFRCWEIFWRWDVRLWWTTLHIFSEFWQDSLDTY